mgnify:CR=1 FL=1
MRDNPTFISAFGDAGQIVDENVPLPWQPGEKTYTFFGGEVGL